MRVATAIVLLLFVALPLLICLSAFSGWIWMLLWNFAIVGAFGAPPLAFGHAWALSFMLGLVLTGIRGVKS